MAFRTRCFGMTDVGRAREENEDNFIILPEEGLYIVADGMGGHASGRLASSLAVTYITEFVCVNRHDDDYEWPYPPQQDRTYGENSLACAIRFANDRIYIEACKDPAHDGMGTTVVCILDDDEDDHEMTLAHVGDSRLYRFRRNELAQITEDHSLVNHLLNTEQISQEEAEDYPNKNVIFRALGLKDTVDVDTNTIRKKDNDVYMLCSDGLTDLVDDWVIGEVLQDAGRDLKSAAKSLIRIANNNGGTDNITLILLYIEET